MHVPAVVLATRAAIAGAGCYGHKQPVLRDPRAKILLPLPGPNPPTARPSAPWRPPRTQGSEAQPPVTVSGKCVKLL